MTLSTNTNHSGSQSVRSPDHRPSRLKIAAQKLSAQSGSLRMGDLPKSNVAPTFRNPAVSVPSNLNQTAEAFTRYNSTFTEQNRAMEQQFIDGAQQPNSLWRAEGVPDMDGHMVSKNDLAIASGIPLKYVEAIEPILKRHKVVGMFRPVNPHATGLLEEGAACKDLNVHGKSSDWGPMAGYIPYDQNFSKKYGQAKAVSSGNASNLQTLKNPRFTKVDLQISEKRLSYLKEQGLVKSDLPVPENEFKALERNGQLPQNFSENYTALLKVPADFKTEDGGAQETEYTFYLAKTKDGKYSVFTSTAEEPTLKPMEIMADAETQAGLTADLDVFAFVDYPTFSGMLPTESSSPTSDGSPPVSPGSTQTPRQRFKELARKVSAGSQFSFELVAKHLHQNHIHRTTDATGSTATERQTLIRREINEAVRKAGYTGGDLIQHGTEQDNIYHPEKDDKIFFVTPNGIRGQTVHFSGAHRITSIAKQAGYTFYNNRSYNTPEYGITWDSTPSSPVDTTKNPFIFPSQWNGSE